MSFVRRLLFSLLIVHLLAVAVGGMASAHETTRSYITIVRDGTAVNMHARIAFRDLEVAVWLDEDINGQITWGEVERRLGAVDGFVLAGLTVQAGGQCKMTRRGEGNSTDSGLSFLELDYSGTCPDDDAPITVESRLFSEIDRDHRTFLLLTAAGKSQTAVLSNNERSVTAGSGGAGNLSTFLNYLRAGAEHLAGGADHLVFLLILMLPSVCMKASGKKAAIRVVAAATGFTIAHAVSLTAAMTDILRPPPALIEVLIAVSIIVTSIDNIRPFLPAPRTAVASFFGLIHGLAFATALGALQISGSNFVLALVGFNLGIEAAQIGFIAVLMPVLFWLGSGQMVLRVGSAAAGIVGLWWLWFRMAPFLGSV